MNLTLGDVAIWGLAALALAWWWRGHAIRERAFAATNRYCQEMGVQLLDETVVLKGLWPHRDSRGSMALRRTYAFEFTATGDDRYAGRAVMLGARMDTIQLAPHRIH